MELPSYVLWGLWLCRNRALFEGKKAPPSLFAHKIRLGYNERKKGARLPQTSLDLGQDSLIIFHDALMGCVKDTRGYVERVYLFILRKIISLFSILEKVEGPTLERELIALWFYCTLERTKVCGPFRGLRTHQ